MDFHGEFSRRSNATFSSGSLSFSAVGLERQEPADQQEVDRDHGNDAPNLRLNLAAIAATCTGNTMRKKPTISEHQPTTVMSAGVAFPLEHVALEKLRKENPTFSFQPLLRRNHPLFFRVFWIFSG